MDLAGDVASTAVSAVPNHTSIALETSLLSVVRAGLWFVARYYCQISLFADLRSVSEETDYIDGSSVLESPTRAAIALEEVGTLPRSKPSSPEPDILPPRPGTRPSSASVPRRDSVGNFRIAHATQNDLATAIFGLAFSESCMLFILLLFGDAVSDR